MLSSSLTYPLDQIPKMAPGLIMVALVIFFYAWFGVEVFHGSPQGKAAFPSLAVSVLSPRLYRPSPLPTVSTPARAAPRRRACGEFRCVAPPRALSILVQNTNANHARLPTQDVVDLCYNGELPRRDDARLQRAQARGRVFRQLHGACSSAEFS